MPIANIPREQVRARPCILPQLLIAGSCSSHHGGQGYLSPLSNATITATASNTSAIAPTTLSTMTITCITALVANDCQIVLPLQSPLRRLLPRELVLLQIVLAHQNLARQVVLQRFPN
jgi:hypothetical protein